MNTQIDEIWYKQEHKRISKTYCREISRLFQYEDCELSPDFFGFLHVYADLNIPKDMTDLSVSAGTCRLTKDQKSHMEKMCGMSIMDEALHCRIDSDTRIFLLSKGGQNCLENLNIKTVIEFDNDII